MKKSILLTLACLTIGALVAPYMVHAISTRAALAPFLTLVFALLLGTTLSLLPPVARSVRAVRRLNRTHRFGAWFYQASPLQPRPPLVAFLAAMGVTGMAGAQSYDHSGLSLGVFAPLSGLLFSLLAAALTGLVAVAAKYLSAKTALVKNAHLREVMYAVEGVALTTVRKINQDAVDTLKAAAADGKLTNLEASAALGTAIKETWAALPALVQALLIQTNGGEGGAKGALVSPIDAAVSNLKGNNQLCAAPISPAPQVITDRPSVSAIGAARARLGLSR